MPTRPIDELESMVGRSVETISGLEVEAGKVEEFARAVRDDNPAYRDADAARDQGFEGVPAPPTFTRVGYFPRYRPDGVEERFPFDLGFRPADRLHGEQTYEYERPVEVGDVLSGTTTLVDVFQKTGRRGGTMTFAVFETETATIIEAPRDETDSA